MYAQDKGGDENFNIYAVNPNDKVGEGHDIVVNRDLTNLKGVRVYIYAVPKSDPDAIFIGLNDRHKAWHDLYKLKISTGEKNVASPSVPELLVCELKAIPEKPNARRSVKCYFKRARTIL